QSIRERYRQQGFSENATKFLMSSWRHSTKHMYDVYIRKWERYASERKVDKVSPPLTAAVNFLASLAESDLSYSAVCTARSALSSYLCTYDGVPFGKNELVKRLIKGVFETKPVFPKYNATWDVNIVLKELETWTPIEKLTLKEISMKLCMLIALLSGQRCQTLQALRTGSTCMELSDKKCTFYVHSLLKHSRSGSHQAPIELHSFTENKSLCVVSTLKEYLRRTKHLRNSNSPNLFLTLLAPHTPASTDTISRWLKWTLARAGVDTNVYTAHSTRAASTSAANDSGASINLIMKAAGWTNASTFAKFYKKHTEEKPTLGQVVLERFLTKH
ncbi:tyrosine-type recombinase/integrase, partial [Thiolapillus sp.]|uniref:tyrosine-type recombinase/integrase n=1 Tax=Thiolapillus sp. TaxID=2017437 RepID=UPI003AF7C940